MAGSQILLVLSSAAFMFMTGGVGLRLLWLSRKTGGLHEWLIGTAFVTMTLLALPLMGASGMGRAQSGDVNVPVLSIGMMVLWVGFTCLVLFIRETFRPADHWSLMLSIWIVSCIAAACSGIIASILASPADLNSFMAGKTWTGLLRIPLMAIYLWAGLEGVREYRMARRRIALGLGNPIVANRFLLWALVGATQVPIHVVSLWLHMRDVPMLGSPLGIFVVSFGGFVATGITWLLFIPPSFYLRFVERRAAGQEV